MPYFEEVLTKWVATVVDEALEQFCNANPKSSICFELPGWQTGHPTTGNPTTIPTGTLAISGAGLGVVQPLLGDDCISPEGSSTTPATPTVLTTPITGSLAIGEPAAVPVVRKCLNVVNINNKSYMIPPKDIVSCGCFYFLGRLPNNNEIASYLPYVKPPRHNNLTADNGLRELAKVLAGHPNAIRDINGNRTS